MPAFDAKELLKEQLEAIAEKKPTKQIKGVEISKSTGVQYNAALQMLVRMINKDVNEKILPLLRKLAPEYQADSIFTTDSYVDDITAALSALMAKWTSPNVKEAATQLASAFIRKANDVNRKRFNSTMKNFGFDVYGDSPALEDYISASVFDNTQLITSIPEQYLTQVQSIVMTNVRAGGRPSSIAKSLQQQYGVASNRAKMIARDQTAKVNGDLTAKRQQAAGFDYFQWVDSDDERVRKRHNEIENKVTAYGKGIYRWDFPPLSDRGIPIIPGQDFQCRCIAIPVSNAQVEINKKEGKVNPNVKR